MITRYIPCAVLKARRTFDYLPAGIIAKSGQTLFEKRPKNYTQAMRDKEEAKGHTMRGGGFPIANTADLARAKHAFGRAGDKPAARRWINQRARDLGAAPLGGDVGKRYFDPEKAIIAKDAHDDIEEQCAAGKLTRFQANAEHVKAVHARFGKSGDGGSVLLKDAQYGVEFKALDSDELRKSLDLKDGLVWGWASVIEKDGKPVIDHQGDIITPDELMKAAHDHITNSRVGGALHLYVPGPNKEVLKAGDIVESMVFTKELQKALGIELPQVGWLVGYKITDPHVKKMVAAGHLKSFSIGGSGQREHVDA